MSASTTAQLKMKKYFHVHEIQHDMEAQSVAVVVEFSRRSNCFKLSDTDYNQLNQ